MKKDDRLPLRHMIEAIDRIERYLDGASASDFEQDTQRYDAVLMNLVVIGEQVNNFDEEFIAQYPDIPWHKMRGLRNIISHHYASVQASLAWDTARNDLPKLRQQLARLL